MAETSEEKHSSHASEKHNVPAIKIKKEPTEVIDKPAKKKPTCSEPTSSHNASQEATCQNMVSQQSNANQRSSMHSSSGNETKPKVSDLVPSENSGPPPFDLASIKGMFGWVTIGNINLPFIVRGETRYIAVRMVECSIISKYARSLPWVVFTCINIKSYYITQNEAALLNEINGQHCEYQYGYASFATNDVVVSISDTENLCEFLSVCQSRLSNSESSSSLNKCGFFLMKDNALLPYVRKGNNRYVPLCLLYNEPILRQVEYHRIDPWDVAYLRFLGYIAGVDMRRIKPNGVVCSVEDLKEHGVLDNCLQEWWPPRDKIQLDCQRMPPSSVHHWPEGVGSPSGQQARFHHPQFQDSNKHQGTIIQSKQASINQQIEKKHQEEILPERNLHPSFISAAGHPIGQCLPTEESISAVPASGFWLDSQLDARNPPLEGIGSTEGVSSSVLPTSPLSSGPQSFNCTKSAAKPSRTEPPPLIPVSESSVFHNLKPAFQPPCLTRMPTLNPPPPLHSAKLAVPQTTVNAIHISPHKCPHSNKSGEDATPVIVDILSLASGSDSRIDSSAQEATVSGSELQVRMRLDGGNEADRSLSETANQGLGLSESHRRTLRSDLQSTSAAHSSEIHSPRSCVIIAPPPHYPTPPQSSPLHPLSLQIHPVTHSYSCLPSARVMSKMSHDVIDLCSPPPSPESVAINAELGLVQPSLLSGRFLLENIMNPSLQMMLPTSPHSTSRGLFTGEDVDINGHIMKAINLEPGNYGKQLVCSISEVAAKLFPNLSAQSCQFALQNVLGVKLHICTRWHSEALCNSGSFVSPNDCLVTVDDLKAYMPQLKYMFQRNERQASSASIDSRCDTEQMPAKRLHLDVWES